MGLIQRVRKAILGSGIPKKSKRELEKKGGDKIVGMFIVSRPIESYVKKLLSVATFGQIDKATKTAGIQDKVRHLFLVINGYIYELNEVLSLGRKQYTRQPEDEVMKVEPTPDMTIQQFIQTAQDKSGSAFSVYHPFQNNCGIWVSNVLKANGLLKSQYKTFINQPVSKVVDNLDLTSYKTIEAITDLGSLVAELKNLFD